MQKTSEVELKNVSKKFINDNQEMYALKKVSGSVAKGSILTIIGPSGSGKSTILSMCNLLSTPDEGEIYIGEKEIREWNIQELRRYVGIAFQSAPMLSGTVRENLCLPVRLNGQSLEEPEKYLEYVGLPKDLLTREASELSGGQRQRLSLARTLVNKPSVLLLDEVTSALDSISSHEIEELIMRINAEKKTTIIWVTHDLNQAERVGTQTWMVMEGILVEAAPTELFFSQPKDSRTKEFLHKMMRDSQ